MAVQYGIRDVRACQVWRTWIRFIMYPGASISGMACATGIAIATMGIATNGNPIPTTPFSRPPRKNPIVATATTNRSMFSNIDYSGRPAYGA